MRQALTTLTIPVKLNEIERSLTNLRHEVEEILADQNDINESTRSQIDAISEALAELQMSHSTDKPRRRIGFIRDNE